MSQWTKQGLGLGLGIVLWLGEPSWASPVSDLAQQADELARNGFPTTAVELYQKAIDLDCQKPLAKQEAALHFNQALLLLKTAQNDQALAALKQTIAINPNHLKGHVNLGLLYADLGKKTEAEQELTTALSLSAGNARLATYILKEIETRHLTDSSPSAANPASLPSPASNSYTAPPVKTGL